MDRIFKSKKEALRNGIFSVLFATILLTVYVNYSSKPISKQKLHKAQIEYNKCYIQELHTKTRLIFNVNGEKYFLSYTLWKDNYKTNDLLAHFSNHNRVNIWLSSPTSLKILGIETEEIYLAPDTGVKSMNQNRKALIGLISAFYIIGAISILKSIMQKN